MVFKLRDNAISKFLNTSIVGNYIDYWSIVHFGAGVFLAFFLDDWRKVLALLILWEVFEFILQGILFQKESLLNIMFDIMFGVMGYLLVPVILSRIMT